MSDVIAAVEKVSGRKIPVAYCARRDGDPAVLVADASRAAAALGWKAQYSSLECMVETAFRWHIQTHCDAAGGASAG